MAGNPLRPTRRGLLGALAATPLLAGLGGARTPKRKLVVVLAHGGWDTTYALDPKPGLDAFDAPAGEVRDFGALPVLVSDDRPSVAAFFERAADISAVIRGISVESLSHPQCIRRILTGVPNEGAADVAAIAATALGSDRPLPYLVSSPAAFPGPYANRTAHTGVTNQLAALIDPRLEPTGVDPNHQPFAPAHDEADLVGDWLRRRLDREVRRRGQAGDNARRLGDFRWSLDQAERLDQYSGYFRAEDAPATFQDQARQAVVALSEGMSWSVAIDSRLDFDTHGGNADQGPLHEVLFGQLVDLLDELEGARAESGGGTLLDETAVIVVSEMTRTPKLNAGGGKDHWPYATLLAFGAGIRGGRVFGGTDEEGLALPIDVRTGEVGAGGGELEPASVLAGLLELTGVDPAPFFPDAEVFRAFLA